MFSKFTLLFISLFILPSSFASYCKKQQGQAVVVMYHQFDGRHPSTSVTMQQFQAQINYFLSSGFRIIPLKEIVNRLKIGAYIPDKTLAITIDDAYRSVYQKAHPLFVKYNIPYTVFVNTEGIDRGYKDYMTWDHLRTLVRSGLVSLEAHGHSHGHLIRSFNAQQRRVDVLTSVRRVYQEAGQIPQFFAYPYGETHSQFMKELQSYRMSLGGQTFQFQAAFSTQSGPIGCSSSLFALPRFALNENYGAVGDLFKIKMNSLHFPILNYDPEDPGLCASQKRRAFSFKVHPQASVRSVNCFSSYGKAQASYNSKEHSVDITLDKAFGERVTSVSDPRERLNCTLPGPDGRFYWIGREFSILNCL